MLVCLMLFDFDYEIKLICLKLLWFAFSVFLSVNSVLIAEVLSILSVAPKRTVFISILLFGNFGIF